MSAPPIRAAAADAPPAGRGVRAPGGSSTQSLARGTGSIETDYLNGEIVLLGRLHGVPVPANAYFVGLSARLVRDRAKPGSAPRPRSRRGWQRPGPRSEVAIRRETREGDRMASDGDESGLRPEFWRRFPLDELNRAEWEALCDGCAKCCLIKLEDETTGEVAYTDIACRLLDLGTCRCGNYALRKQLVAGCVAMTRTTSTGCCRGCRGPARIGWCTRGAASSPGTR